MDPFPLPLLLPLVFVGVVVLLPYVVGPILIRLSLKLAAEPRPVPFTPGNPPLPPEVERHFQTATEQLGPCGFAPVAWLALPRQTPNVKAILLLLANRQAGDVAFAVAMFLESPQGIQLKTRYVEIVSSFRDGTAVVTTNVSELGAFGPRPTHSFARLPEVEDAGRLYHLHRAILARSGKFDKVLRLDEQFGGDATASLTACLVEEMQAQLPTGYLFLSADEKVYRPTWYGAVLMTWKLIWPVTAIRRALQARRARRLLAELEADVPA